MLVCFDKDNKGRDLRFYVTPVCGGIGSGVSVESAGVKLSL